MASESVPDEIEISTEWEDLISENHLPLTLRTPIENVDIHLIDQLFTNAECTRLLQEAEKNGFGKTNYRKDYRGNLRLTINDKSFAIAVWERLEDIVPATVEEEGNTYVAMGLNPRWRLAKYLPGKSMHSLSKHSFIFVNFRPA